MMCSAWTFTSHTAFVWILDASHSIDEIARRLGGANLQIEGVGPHVRLRLSVCNAELFWNLAEQRGAAACP